MARSVVVVAALLFLACQFEVTGLSISGPDLATGGESDLSMAGDASQAGDAAMTMADLSVDQAMPSQPDQAMPSPFLNGQVLAPPPRTDGAAAYCPACWAAYRDGFVLCGDCGFLLEAFEQA